MAKVFLNDNFRIELCSYCKLKTYSLLSTIKRFDSSTNAKIIIARYIDYATAGTLGVNIDLYPFAFQEVGWIGICHQYHVY